MNLPLVFASLTLFAIAAPFAAVAQGPAASSPTAAVRDGLHDFDFLIGSWRVRHHRLKDRLAGSHEWEDFDGISNAQIILGGIGNLDDNVLEISGGTYRGATLRTYDAKTGLWRIWWVDSRSPDAALDPPVVGHFENGVGVFYSDEMFRGKPIKVRFTWSRITPVSCHWEQAFSPDGGKTWEVNWTNDFQRISN